jgi:signal transduction histidine kinase
MSVAKLESARSPLAVAHRRELESRAAMIEHSIAAVLAYDDKSRMIYCNRAALQLCGAEDLDELRESGFPRVQTIGQDSDRPFPTLLTRDGFIDQALLEVKPAKILPCIISSNQLRDEDGEFMLSYANILDATEMHAYKARLKQTNLDLRESEKAATLLEHERRDAESASNAKSQFMANMSHELRTPLNAIIGYSELMLEDAQDEGAEERASDLSKIRASGRQLLELINDVLDISKIEAGKIELDNKPVELAEILSEVESIAVPLMEVNGNRFKIIAPDEMGRIECDEQRLRQVLLNLLSNAAKFTEKGDIDLSVERDGAGWVRFVVRDSGIGMSGEQVERLFQPFVQADSSITQRFGGTGLGLVISQRFVEMMGGRITIESELGEGSCLTVWMPKNGHKV